MNNNEYFPCQHLVDDVITKIFGVTHLFKLVTDAISQMQVRHWCVGTDVITCSEDTGSVDKHNILAVAGAEVPCVYNVHFGL